MFQKLGNAVSRGWPAILAAWVLLLAVLATTAPSWDSVVHDGEFRYLPDEVPSRRAEELFKSAFSNDLLGSSIVVVVRRESRDEGLYDEDREFIEQVLRPRLEQIAGIEPTQEGGDEGTASSDPPATPAEPGDATAEKGTGEPAKSDAATSTAAAPAPANAAAESAEPVVSRIRTFSDKTFGSLLESDDNKASLVIIELTTEFMELRNRETIEKIEELIGTRGELGLLGREQLVPPGLDLSISGPATVGRDMRAAAKESASATERMTIVLVIILLLGIYRAPVLALIPLITVFVAVKIAIHSLATLAGLGWLQLFNGIEVYVTVVLYGAGVDFCMFLMARYKEELDAGATYEEALSTSVGRVGAAVTASAGTVMFGIGMMVFAQFGKFQQAGIAMSVSLAFVLLAALTFTPALLCLAGRWAFWPRLQTERVAASQGWISPTSLVARIMEKEWFASIWHKVGQMVLKRPGLIWMTCVAVMIPFAVISLEYQGHLSYGLLSELPSNKSSVIGAKAIQRHFPAGITGPVMVLFENPKLNFREDEAWMLIRDVSQKLYDDRESLGISDIRCVAEPLGMTPRVQDRYSGVAGRAQKRIGIRRGFSHYVSDKGEHDGHVTRMDVVFHDDPFSRDSMDQFDTLKAAVAARLPDELKADTQLHFLGSTASLRDLKTITSADQVRIDILVPGVVFVILIVLLRKVATPAYLIFTVFFSYLVTLGIAFALFWAIDPGGFAGLDWKVRMFLFTILIAVGQDYNIFLITRIEEEQRQHGPVQGVIEALLKTGSIISSCGIIMAGTFSSLMWGSLMGMKQLGFALAFGVLLDTFVVRPILVPCYLILLHRGQFGGLGRFLGAHRQPEPERALPVEAGGSQQQP